MSSTDLGARLRQHFIDGTVWYDRDASEPHDAIISALRGGELSPMAVARELPALVDDDDVRVRTGVVAILFEVRSYLGAATIARWLVEHEGRLRGVRPAWRMGSEDLEARVASELASVATPEDRDVTALLGRLAASRPWGERLFVPLARLDPALRATLGSRATAGLAPAPATAGLAEAPAAATAGLAPRLVHHIAYVGAAFSGRTTALVRARTHAPPWSPTGRMVASSFDGLATDRAELACIRAGERALLRLETYHDVEHAKPGALERQLRRVQGVVLVLDASPGRFASGLAFLRDVIVLVDRVRPALPRVCLLTHVDVTGAAGSADVRAALGDLHVSTSWGPDGEGGEAALLALVSRLEAPAS